MWNSLQHFRKLFSQRSNTGRLEKSLAADPDNPEILFNLALAYAAAGQDAAAIRHYRAVLAARPDFSAASFNLALLLKQSGNTDEAIDVLKQALQSAPSNGEILSRLRHVMDSGLVPAWHFSMMNDELRNSAYELAIRSVVQPGDSVLEIGTGAGLLAMMAARKGAGKVVTCEMVEPLAAKARKIVEENGFAAQITVFASKSNDLRIPEHLPEPADILIAEIISSDLLGEGILDSYDDARARLLKPDARIMPCGATIVGQLAGSPELAQFLRVGNIAGFDLRSFNDFTPTILPVDELGLPMQTFSAAFDVFEFDFHHRTQPRSRTFSVNVTENGLCYGVLQWIRLQLCEGVQYENAPRGSATALRHGHWRQVLHTFQQPLNLQKGQTLQLVAAHDRTSLMFFSHQESDESAA